LDAKDAAAAAAAAAKSSMGGDIISLFISSFC
jgi:hypothetical protein